MSIQLPFRVFGCFAGIVISLLSWYFVATKILGLPVERPSPTRNNNIIPIYIVSNGTHTDICLPADSNWRSFLNQYDAHNVNYISFGWGDRGFYLDTPTWNDLKISTAIHAVFLPSETAMHVTYWGSAPREKHNSIILLHLSPEELSTLREFIMASFKTKNGNAHLIKNALPYSGKPNEFYEAKGKYHAIKTCNEWTRQALKSANQPVPTWTPFAADLMHALETK